MANMPEMAMSDAEKIVSSEHNSPIRKTGDRERIHFLDQLRAIAVLLVVWGHIFLVGINDPTTVGVWVPTVKNFIFGPDTIAKNPHGQFGLKVMLTAGINSGPLGVAIFFLISGFVILKTIDNSRPLNFLIRRFFRIIPLCGAVVLFTALVSVVYCAINHVPQPNTITGVLTSIFAMNYFNSSFATTPVLWTLAVEMTFYLVMATTATVIGRINFGAMIFLSLICVLYVALMGTAVPREFSPVVRDRLLYVGSLLVHINFMLVGALIYRGYSDKKWLAGIAYTALTLMSYIFCFKLYKEITNGRDIGVALPDVYAALALFLLAFALRPRGRFLLPLQWIGSISYPLYLVHIPLAWGVLAWLGGKGWGMNIAAVSSVAIVILVAWVFHILVELPAQGLGKKAINLLGLNRRNIVHAESAVS
jgi:peptidoglycan/LPS O-acetylase OafA/YrhL